MKKVLLSICMVSAVFAMSSCGSTKEAASLSSLNGEWNIFEVNGSAIVRQKIRNCRLLVLIQLRVKYMVIVVVTV